MNEINQNTTTSLQAKRSFWGLVMIATILVLIYTYAFFFSEETTFLLILSKAGFFAAIVTTLIGLVFTLRNRLEAASKFIYPTLLMIGVMVSSLVQGRALPAFILVVIVTAIGNIWVFPQQVRRRFLVMAALTGVLMWAIEWINPSWRQPTQLAQAGPIGAIALIVVFAVFLFIQARQAISSSLRSKITVWTGAIILVSTAVLVVYSVVTSRQSAIQSAEVEAQSFANSQAQQIRADIEIPLDTARALAQALTAVKDPNSNLSLTREQVNAMLRQVLVKNESFLGTYTLWEPNAFNGSDDTYRNTPIHDSTGRFIPYWIRSDDGSVTVIALEQYETPGIGDWYILPRQNKMEMTFAPLIYPIAGVDTVMASFIVPIIYDNTFYGIAGVDAPIAFVQNIVDSVNLYNGQADAILLTASGTLIGVRNRPDLVNQPATEVYADFADLQARIKAGESFASLSPDGQYLRVFAPVDIGQTGAHWSFGLIIPFSEITAPATASALRQGLISAALILVAITILWFLTGQIVRPIRDLTTVANAISQGDLNATANVESVDETGILASAFNTMTSQLRRTLATLEERVAERTHSLELAAEVGRSVSQVRELNVMLKDAAEIIRSRFDLYYTQVYLTNPSQNTLILQSGTGTVGAELAGSGHRLPINTNSINGRAVVEKQPVIISDTSASASFRPNPLLPETRSEMAVPLMVGEKVVGVLDLQSNQSGFLNEEILPAFEALAGQLAIAIQNANLLAETEQARAEVEKQAKRLTRTNWQEYLDAIHKPEEVGLVFEQNKIAPLSGQEVSSNENALTAPIAVTGEALGNLVVEMEGQSPIARASELVNAIARQVGQQIESLRLLDSAERYRFEAEEASRRLTREGWKDYMEVNANEGLSFIYDLKEVRPHDHNGDQGTDEAALTLPLKIRDETVGRLVVQGLGSDDTESLELASAVAERLSAHIEDLRQFDQTQSALAQSEKLFEASRLLSQAQDLQELTASTVKMLNIPEINRAVLATFNYDKEGNVDSLDIIANWWNGTGHEITPVGTHYPLEVIRVMPMFVSPTPVFFNDTSTDKRVDATTMQLVQRLNLRAVAVLPLFRGTRQIGALILEAEEPHTFTTEETRLFASLAPQIATVLENRRQFERAQKQAERESMLNTISQKIQSATSVEAVLQIAARELGHALGAPLTIAQLGVKDGK